MSLRETYDPYRLCPCESGIKAKYCCKRGKAWFKPPADIKPAGSPTGFSNPSCYAQLTADCDNKITGEHYISRGLLADLGDGRTAKIAGLNWQKPETFTVVGLNSLTSNILCRRHNNALSPVDAGFARFNGAIDQYQQTQKNSVTAVEPDFRLFNGIDIERWMLKTLFGLVASKNIKATSMRAGALDILYGKEPWPNGAGLYLDTTSAMYESDSLLIETMTHEETVLAAKFTIAGLRLILLIGKPDAIPNGWLWHPTTIILTARGVDKILELSWDKVVPIKFARFERHHNEFDGPPPDWQEWERLK